MFYAVMSFLFSYLQEYVLAIRVLFACPFQRRVVLKKHTHVLILPLPLSFRCLLFLVDAVGFLYNLRA